jgi:hypothetical protein
VTVSPLLPLLPSIIICTVGAAGLGRTPAKNTAPVGLVITKFDAPAAIAVLVLTSILFCKNKGFCRLIVEFAGRLKPICTDPLTSAFAAATAASNEPAPTALVVVTRCKSAFAGEIASIYMIKKPYIYCDFKSIR